MRQRLTFIALKQNDVAGFSLLLAPWQTQADPIDFAGNWLPIQLVPRSPLTELFFAPP